MSRSRRLLDRLARVRVLAGLLQERPGPMLRELAAACSYDFLILDAQRGVFSTEEFTDELKAQAAAKRTLAMVRLAGHDTAALRQYLEFDVDAIVVPEVSTADEARDLARAMQLNQRASLIVILESARAAAHAQDILSVDGVDAAFVGPINLSTDLGCSQDYTHPAYEQALSRIERAAASTGKVLGTVPNDTYPAELLIARGHRLFILGSDLWLLQEAMKGPIAMIRALNGKGSACD